MRPPVCRVRISYPMRWIQAISPWCRGDGTWSVVLWS
jgi:hypothetical protein